MKGPPYQSPPPIEPYDTLTIQFIEFTYCNDRIPDETINRKIEKYQPLMDNIANKRWKVDPLIVITAGVTAATHIPSIDSIESTFKIPKHSIKNTFEAINVIAIQYAMSVILHKRIIENNEPIPIDTQLDR